MKINKTEREKARQQLSEMLKEGDTIYCVLRSVARSGMSRQISFFQIRKNELYCLDYLISDLLGLRFGNKGGLVVTGCGMDMGFATVYEISSALFPDDERGGYKISREWI